MSAREARDRALRLARILAGRGLRPGDVVLFSPACASFDQFRDYEARGDAFRSLVQGMTRRDGKNKTPEIQGARP